MASVQHIIGEVNKHQIIKSLNWTELQYCNYQQQIGLEYMQRVVGSDEWGIKQLEASELFWRWWVNHWNRIDEEFMTYGIIAPETMREHLYTDLHDPEGFEFYPHRLIIEQSYAILMDSVLADGRKEVLQ